MPEFWRSRPRTPTSSHAYGPRQGMRTVPNQRYLYFVLTAFSYGSRSSECRTLITIPINTKYLILLVRREVITVYFRPILYKFIRPHSSRPLELRSPPQTTWTTERQPPNIQLPAQRR